MVWGEESVAIALGASQKKSEAQRLKMQAVSALKTAEHNGVHLRKIGKTWLVVYGPVRREVLEKEEILSRLSAAGLTPVILRTSPGTRGIEKRTEDQKSFLLQWTVLIGIGGVGIWFFYRRFRDVRRLIGRQSDLEKSQMRLKREMEEGEIYHG
jgi:hypothetical protein